MYCVPVQWCCIDCLLVLMKKILYSKRNKIMQNQCGYHIRRLLPKLRSNTSVVAKNLKLEGLRKSKMRPTDLLHPYTEGKKTCNCGPVSLPCCRNIVSLHATHISKIGSILFVTFPIAAKVWIPCHGNSHSQESGMSKKTLKSNGFVFLHDNTMTLKEFARCRWIWRVFDVKPTRAAKNGGYFLSPPQWRAPQKYHNCSH